DAHQGVYQPVVALVNRTQPTIKHEQIAVSHLHHSSTPATALVTEGEALKVRVQVHGVMQQPFGNERSPHRSQSCSSQKRLSAGRTSPYCRASPGWKGVPSFSGMGT